MPLKLLFETSEREKIVPVHKKEEKNLLKNYHPIGLLPIFSKIFERVIYNSLFNHFVSDKRFTIWVSTKKFMYSSTLVNNL